jgi:uncharacterized membrane protein HdeD (DUF308 family)
MLSVLAQYWWLIALRGLAAIVFGIIAFIWPGPTIGALVLLFGAYALVDGIATIVMAVSHRQQNDRWWVLLLEGLAGVILGVLTFIWPGVTAVVLLYFIAAWALVTGIFEIVAAIRLRKEIEGEWVLGLSGLASVIFGLILVFRPGAGALALIWVIAAYAIIFGVLLIYLAFKVRGMGQRGDLEMQHVR